MSGTVGLPSRAGIAIKYHEPEKLTETLTTRWSATDIRVLSDLADGRPVGMLIRGIVREWLAVRELIE